MPPNVAIEGGNIKHIISESGAMLKKGDVILELTNLTREISVLEQESNLTQSINRGRDTKLALTQNALRQQESLITIDNALATLKPKHDRQKQLYEKKLKGPFSLSEIVVTNNWRHKTP